MDVVLEALPWRAGRHTRYTGDGDAIGIEGRVVYLPDRQLTFDEEAIDAVWAQFDADDVRFLCVLQPETIRIVGSDGRSFDVAIPFKCNAFWALNRGLLLSVPSGHDVYYLGHPLDPFVPVLTQHDVVFASAVPSMVVTHNIETRTHSVFVPTLPSSTLSMATTEQGEETLCFVADGHVDIFLVGNASRIAVVDGIVDAVPVNSVCGDGVRDMVVLERDGRLSIWTAGKRRCDLNTSPVASIADPAGSELTVVLADGNAFRARLAPMSTYPSRMVFDALCADPDIPRDVLFAIITEFHSSRRGERNCGPGSIADREWRYLSALVVAVVSGRPPTAAPKALGAGQAWAVLLSSDYHADESTSPTFPFDPFSFVDDVSKEVNEFGGSASRHPLGTVILETLHLLYETCKLSTLTACYLRRLASLLFDIARLCGRIDYSAHYARDFGDLYKGFAHGLRVVQQQSIDRAWVGHLAGLSRSDLYWYLSKKHDPTTIAVLLGLSASSRGTMDSTVSRMLCLHIPALLPSGFADLDVPILVQTTALLGIGLVYQGTCHRLMSEVLLAEINKRPFLADGSCADREAHALAAGLSLGLVNLGRGDDAPGLADLHIEDCLLELMVGGKDLSLLTAGKRPGSSTATHGRQPSISTSYDPNSKSCLVREATMTNVDVTCPGATLALGLMFLKTNNLHIANRLAPPETNFELESTRPDFLLLRVLSRSLVLWDSIRPSRAWLQSTIPDILSKHDLNDGERNCEVDVFASDACVGDIDVETIRKSYCHIIAGACLALGIRFAGTANASASTLLHEHVSWFQRMKNQAALTRKLDRNTIDTCLATCALGYAVVLAGTGNLDALRLLRSLRRSLDSETSYGFNMALHMSIGLLFLGGGRSSLSTSSPAIAALVIALFPRFPMSTTDNRDHVQAFRHLYVLAVEPRYLETRDVDNGRPCYVPLVVQLSHGEQRNIIAPCLLPSPDTVESIRVESPRFWPLVLDLKGSDAHKSLIVQNGVMFVKRKTGHLPYRQDPLGRRGILSRSFPRLTHLSSGKQSQRRAAVHREAFVESFAADSVLVEFAKDFCGEGTPSGEFSTAVLFECLTRDTPDMIPTYFAVYEIVNDLARQVNSLGIWQIKFALELCSSQSGSPNGNVIQEEFLMAVRSHLNAYFSSPEFDAALSHYIGQSGSYPSTPMFGYSQSTTAVLFSMFLTFFDIPLHAKLSQCLDSLRQWPPGGNFLPKLSRMFPTVPVQGLVRIERAVKAMRLHAEQVA
ncbi:unnamed protein product (mitochondrion) [Plasmodiophora brassicae]|uniref:Uncharacterized protein n=1 Tax=Plasmodiophora brassicae TaxID=37360 RepID=A0A3P3Y4U8_PLABS|nr:unnamed protein product [Plasmodiophora brassicae]